ncbi:phosphopantetheine-binding protein [Nonomuraea sp. NPDC051941]|uniref:acyl carrier protein n=1 Tax=Nonomuraea sp. NPDC051941 TaxID=3364373 RepID=UPI0037C6AC19
MPPALPSSRNAIHIVLLAISRQMRTIAAGSWNRCASAALPQLHKERKGSTVPEDLHSVSAEVAGIIRAVLLVDTVEMTDNLFDLGADSLTVLEICTQLEELFEVEVPLEPVWEASTTADIIHIVEGCVEQQVKVLGQPAAGRTGDAVPR